MFNKADLVPLQLEKLDEPGSSSNPPLILWFPIWRMGLTALTTAAGKGNSASGQDSAQSCTQRTDVIFLSFDRNLFMEAISTLHEWQALLIHSFMHIF